MLFLAIGIVSYVVVLGMLMQFTPAILGAVFSVVGDLMQNPDIDAEWLTVYDDLDDLTQLLVPMMFSLLLVLLVIKVLMAAGVTGRD